NCQSNGAAASITPVNPAIRNWNRKPTQNSIGVANQIRPPYMVAIQLKILIPVGTATSIVEITKKMLEPGDMPMVNMWWAQTLTPMAPMPTVAPTMAARPNIGFREKTGMISDAQANPGSIRM